MGAGDAGAMMVREIEQNDDAVLKIAGFIDDDPRKQGSKLSGFNVLGTTEEIVDICQRDL